MGLWARAWQSTWNPEAYREAASRSVGSSFGYLALLITLAVAVLTATVQFGVTRFVREFKETRYWEKNFPEIRITDGKVSSPVEQPFTFEEDDFVFILDTRDATKELDLSYRNGILLTRTDLIYRSRPGETRHYSLEKFPNLILNQATVERFLQLIRNWTWVVTAFFLTIWFWIAKLIQVLFWSLLSLVVNAITKRSLPYRALFNIGVLALTVPFAFDLVKDTLGLRAPGLGWISLALYVGYLIWGILVQSKPVQSDLP